MSCWYVSRNIVFGPPLLLQLLLQQLQLRVRLRTATAAASAAATTTTTTTTTAAGVQTKTVHVAQCAYVQVSWCACVQVCSLQECFFSLPVTPKPIQLSPQSWPASSTRISPLEHTTLFSNHPTHSSRATSITQSSNSSLSSHQTSSPVPPTCVT